MAPIDLNTLYDYSIDTPYPLTNTEEETINTNPPITQGHWKRKIYEPFKQNLKRNYLIQQNGRCAYCRKQIEPDGYYEPIEHIVAKSIKPTWMLEVKNLVITCNSCNNLKNKEQTLTTAHENDIFFPGAEDAFIIFNPHYDRWRNHFQIEDEIFLTALPNSKGPNTIRICNLNRYQIPINNIREIRMSNVDSFRTIAHRLYSLRDPSKKEYIEMKAALEHFELIIDPNILPALKINYPILPRYFVIIPNNLAQDTNNRLLE